MMRAICAVGLVLLAGCGADGPPFVPTTSGTISVGSQGVTTSTTVGATNGSVSVGLTL